MSDIVNAMSPDRPYIEESRECLGLAIAVAACAIHLVWALRAAKAPAAEPAAETPPAA